MYLKKLQHISVDICTFQWPYDPHAETCVWCSANMLNMLVVVVQCLFVSLHVTSSLQENPFSYGVVLTFPTLFDTDPQAERNFKKIPQSCCHKVVKCYCPRPTFLFSIRQCYWDTKRAIRQNNSHFIIHFIYTV